PYHVSGRESAGSDLMAGWDALSYNESVECFACTQCPGGDADVISRIELENRRCERHAPLPERTKRVTVSSAPYSKSCRRLSVTVLQKRRSCGRSTPKISLISRNLSARLAGSLLVPAAIAANLSARGSLTSICLPCSSRPRA